MQLAQIRHQMRQTAQLQRTKPVRSRQHLCRVMQLWSKPSPAQQQQQQEDLTRGSTWLQSCRQSRLLGPQHRRLRKHTAAPGSSSARADVGASQTAAWQDLSSRLTAL